MRAARQVKLTLGIGVVLLGGVVAVTLTRTPPRVLRVGSRAETLFTRIDGGAEICQPDEVLPAGSTAVRLQLPAFFGAPVSVRAFSGSREITHGARNPDWTGSSVTIPVTPLRQTITSVRLCFKIGPNSEPLDVVGQKTPRAQMAVLDNRSAIGGRLSVEDIGSGSGSWWTRVLAVARHIGLGRALTGTWIALLIAALMAAVGLLALRLTLRDLP